MRSLNHDGHEEDRSSKVWLRVLRASALVLTIAATAAGAQQKIDAAKSRIRFETKQMNVPVEGAFRKFDGSVAFDPARPEATKAEFEVDLGSIDLGSDEGNTEVKRKAWLNVDAFPKAKFVAASVKSLGGGKFEAHGPLTIKGVSQDIAAHFTMTEAGAARIVEGEFTLKRLQYKIGDGPWADTETVADEVVVRFHFAIPTK